MSIIYSTTTAAGSSGWMSDNQLTVVLDSNVRLDVKNKGTKGWHPSIVMRALKTAKLKPAELAELSVRLKKLSKMAFTAQETGTFVSAIRTGEHSFRLNVLLRGDDR